MKNKRAVIMMALAVLLGLLAVALAASWLLNAPGASAGRIVVAKADVDIGQRLTPEMFKLADWPADSVPKGAFTDPAPLGGRVLRSSLLAGEPISEAKLAPAGTLGGLSALITEGKRAITVRVNDVIGVAGFTLPGNYVDIIVSTETMPDPNATRAREQSISKIVLERILVLAVAQEVNRDETKPKVVNAVTLEVTPSEAEKLDLARSVGTLSLALRNQVDPAAAATFGATKENLLPAVAAAPPPVVRAPPRPRVQQARAPAPPKRDCISVINGLHASQECF
ncbi:pilus assembly protein CpaB [Massilia sp. UYP32]|jgi:pilus assembly protein CpaB|uniref:Flp pilus assembly protein CpaB n=1 Tax=Massilia timonae CCUG 45783 TaxID=883126 RepID=K9DGX6_9BURK|nr:MULTISPECIES: Flp pilus assembly protein CpaB [Massilia]EKU83984.1 flp pilus assembly protein CpaB [Massilia timonae CCUG 45783]QYG00498.1 Flp pilus assembly protein CpaB [Massilia sp. NP310]